MKNKSILLRAVMLGASLLVAARVSAFPLYLTSVNGTISYTPSFNNLSTSNTVQLSTAAVNMKTIMGVVSNTAYLTNGVTVPADAMIAYDPYFFATYLTNADGFYYDLAPGGSVVVGVTYMATSFRKGAAATNEMDKILSSFRVSGIAPDGLYFQFYVQGRGTLQFSVDKNNKGSMTISMPQGARYGAYKNSASGVSWGQFTFRGKGTPEWSGPYSTWWSIF